MRWIFPFRTEDVNRLLDRWRTGLGSAITWLRRHPIVSQNVKNVVTMLQGGPLLVIDGIITPVIRGYKL